MSKLSIAEVFFSIQGEGRHSGTPAVFVRVAGCNLSCGAVGRDLAEVNPTEDDPVEGASWLCDTIDVWRKPDNVYSTEEFIDELRARGWIENLLEKDVHFVLTGGEPTMPNHQEAWTDFMNRFEAVFGETPFVEVETNGTFVFTKDFLETVDHVNCSLKLSNSGHSIDDRIKPEAIGQLQIFDQTQSPVTFDWKFVVSGQDDIEEVNDLVTSFNMENVILMPAGLSREQLKETYPRAIEFAKERGWKVTGREHITAYDEKTGV